MVSTGLDSPWLREAPCPDELTLWSHCFTQHSENMLPVPPTMLHECDMHRGIRDINMTNRWALDLMRYRLWAEIPLFVWACRRVSGHWVECGLSHRALSPLWAGAQGFTRNSLAWWPRLGSATWEMCPRALSLTLSLSFLLCKGRIIAASLWGFLIWQNWAFQLDFMLLGRC
jgi:hypothetical protein